MDHTFQSEISLRHSTYGRKCREKIELNDDNNNKDEKRNSNFKGNYKKTNKWLKTLSSVVIGVTSYYEHLFRI